MPVDAEQLKDNKTMVFNKNIYIFTRRNEIYSFNMRTEEWKYENKV